MTRQLPNRHWDRLPGGRARGVAVLLGSLGSNSSMWDSQIPALLPLVDVLRIEHRGHGGSGAPPGPYQLEDLAGDVIAVMDAEHVDRASFVGLSIGGMVALTAALQWPERVKDVAVLCTSAALGPADYWSERADRVRAGELPSIAADVVSRWLTPPFAHQHPEVVSQLIQMITATDPIGYAGCCEAIAGMQLADRLVGVNVPLLAISATGDRTTSPPHLRAISDSVPRGRCVEIDGAHLVNVENPDAVNRLLVDHLTLAPSTPGGGSTVSTTARREKL